MLHRPCIATCMSDRCSVLLSRKCGNRQPMALPSVHAPLFSLSWVSRRRHGHPSKNNQETNSLPARPRAHLRGGSARDVCLALARVAHTNRSGVSNPKGGCLGALCCSTFPVTPPTYLQARTLSSSCQGECGALKPTEAHALIHTHTHTHTHTHKQQTESSGCDAHTEQHLSRTPHPLPHNQPIPLSSLL